MPQAVRERRPVPSGRDHSARGGVHLLARHRERHPQLHRGGLGVVHQVEHLLELIARRVAVPDGARDVGGVAADLAARVDEHHHLLLELGAARPAVGQGARRAELHQTVPAGGAAAAHVIGQRVRHLALGDAGRERGERGGDRRLGDGDGAADQRQLFGELDHAQPVGHRLRALRPPPGAERSFEPQRRVVVQRPFEDCLAAAALRLHRPDRLPDEHEGVVLLLPPAHGEAGESRVTGDALDFERRAHDHGRAPRRHEQADEPLAAARVVAGEVGVVGAGGGDEEIELAGGQLGAQALDAPRENLGAELGGRGPLRGRPPDRLTARPPRHQRSHCHCDKLSPLHWLAPVGSRAILRPLREPR